MIDVIISEGKLGVFLKQQTNNPINNFIQFTFVFHSRLKSLELYSSKIPNMISTFTRVRGRKWCIHE